MTADPVPYRRYFVVVVDDEGAPRYVLAETTREVGDDGEWRDSSAAAGIGGSSARVMTDVELAADSDGAELLASWSDGDDSTFHRESAELEGANDRGAWPPLRLVREDDDPPPDADPGER